MFHTCSEDGAIFPGTGASESDAYSDGVRDKANRKVTKAPVSTAALQSVEINAAEGSRLSLEQSRSHDEDN